MCVLVQGLARVLAGVDLALQLGYSPVKINVVLMRGACAAHIIHTRNRMTICHNIYSGWSK